MVSEHASARSVIQLRVVNISPRWRAIDDFAIWKRVIGGSIQFIRDFAHVLVQLCLRPHVVHLTTSGQFAVARDLLVMKAARLFKVPVIYHIRFGRVPQLAKANSREWRLISRAMRLAHTVIAIDGYTEQAIRDSLPEVRVVRIPNCVDISSLPKPSTPSSEEQTVMFLGWVIPTKGVEELIQAWASLRPDGWQLQVVGPGNTDYQHALMDKYQPTGLEFLGEKNHSEAMLLLADADVFVLPSYTEGFPNVVVESMALGKPIVATRVGAIPEMLSDGCGFLIEARDVDGLKSALTKLMADAELRQSIGARAQERAINDFSLDAVFERYMALWREAAGLD